MVYLAFDPEMERRVALKLPRLDLLYDPAIRRRWLREARAAARLDHPNLVPVYEAGPLGPLCYIASAYAEGSSLARWLEHLDAPLDSVRTARMALALAGAVAHVNARGLLHAT